MTKSVKIAGIHHRPKWEWSATYRHHVAEHARYLICRFSSGHLTGNVKMTVVDYNTGRAFRRFADQDQAERMARYALWLYERDNGTALNPQLAQVSLNTGLVRFAVEQKTTVEKKVRRARKVVTVTEMIDVPIPNHNWQPVVTDSAALEFHAA